MLNAQNPFVDDLMANRDAALAALEAKGGNELRLLAAELLDAERALALLRECLALDGILALIAHRHGLSLEVLASDAADALY